MFVQYMGATVHWEIFSKPGDIMSTLRDTMINVGKVVGKTIEFVCIET